MPSARKFYKTVFTVTVLSEEPLSTIWELGELQYRCTEGDCSGQMEQGESEELDGPTAAHLLEEQGSTPAFFQLTPEGEDDETYRPEGYDPVGGGGGSGRSDLPYGQGGGGD